MTVVKCELLHVVTEIVIKIRCIIFLITSSENKMQNLSDKALLYIYVLYVLYFSELLAVFYSI